MRSRLLSFGAAAVAALLSSVSTASAQSVTFSGIRDAVPSKYFDATTSTPSDADPNQLIIGLNSGFDPDTLTSNEFAASTLAFSNRVVADTLSFTVAAPPGF